MNNQKLEIHNLSLNALRFIEAAESLDGSKHGVVKDFLFKMAKEDLEGVCSLTE